MTGGGYVICIFMSVYIFFLCVEFLRFFKIKSSLYKNNNALHFCRSCRCPFINYKHLVEYDNDNDHDNAIDLF